ncbi:MAG: ATP-grasp domain-containing protein [Paludisphaera borealis]|uniref:ATP-grasp domain-containing protein n=1 Tax=Paludisphaera borealis TaxID=1387353 RepID=UPI00284D5180|nr:ATP-grasp domain-containing protein [Paludisphaera borealis]MDR3619203.1 ATP-grasp domain-containing protein [Paludisphaera borealis]
MPTTADVLIVGASTRAAAFSAARAGLRPRCLDQYADADLADLFPTSRFDPLEDDARLDQMAAAHDCPAWFYTGPLENHPGLIERLKPVGRLLGNGPETLRAIRDPWRVAAALARNGLAGPSLARVSERPPAPGRWLLKPLASAGGRSIFRAEESAPRADASFYYQEFVDGPTLSALYVAAAGRARLLGVVRQFQGAPGAPFLYRGGIGPWSVSDATTARLRRLGTALASDFPLVGLFGVDFILNDDEPWPIEVNPRYTASVEILELAMGRALLRDHVLACSEGRLPEALGPSASRIVGKRILYARQRLVAPPIAVPGRSVDLFAVPSIADVPWPGTTIDTLEPIMTVFATATTAETCAERLDQIEAEWMERLERAGE